VDRDHVELAVSRQREDCLKFCAAKGWHAPFEYVDNDISASTEPLDDLRRSP
jgi:DNA invertase Pin-like site-specific DNA recombinase